MSILGWKSFNPYLIVIYLWHPAWILLLIFSAMASLLIAYQIGLVDKVLSKSDSQFFDCESLEYHIIMEEMTLAEVQAILQNRGKKTNRRSNVATYTWRKNGVKITVEFEDGRLVEKSQEPDFK